jgi:urease accessory protein
MEATTTRIRTSETGQHGSLRLSFGPRGGRTVLVGRYSKAPFGAVQANYPDGSGIPEVQITNPCGGVLGGDRLELEITAGPGSDVTVLTQSANKAYRGAEAAQRTTIDVGEGAFLEYLPHHLIPFAGSAYRQNTEFCLAPDASLIAWDAYAAGRVARGERFAFDRLCGRTRVTRKGVPQVADGFELVGGTESLGGYSYSATAYVLAPVDLGTLTEELHIFLSCMPGTLASASAPASGLCAARILAEGADALYGALNGVRTLARATLDLPAPAREVR